MSSHHTRPDQAGNVETGKIAKQRFIRQPLGVKNVMSSSNQNNEGTLLKQQDRHHHQPIKPLPSPTNHLLPPPRQRKPDVVTLAPNSHFPIQAPSAQSVTTRKPVIISPNLSTEAIGTSQYPSLQAYNHNLRTFNSKYPSPLGQAAEVVTEDCSEMEVSSSSIKAVRAAHHSHSLVKAQSPPLVKTESPSLVKTPKKRAIPLEDVHVRNTVPGQQGDSPNPNKRSRSSKEDSSATDPSTGTSLSIATGLGDVQLQSYGTAASATLAAVAPRPAPPIPSIPSKGATSRPTTTRIDKQSRMTENERNLREKQKNENHKEWRKKYIRIFPSLRFHLDSIDEATRIEVTAAVTRLGATVDPFFSASVTHLITARKIPAGVLPDAPVPLDAAKGKAPSAAINRGSVRSNLTQTRLSKLSPAMRKRQTNVPLHSDRNPFEERGPPLPSNDILVKARDFNIKIWSMDKFKTVLTGLLGSESAVDNAKGRLDLAQMLEKEKVASALEKDPLVARDNFHIFPKNAVYMLVEDATAEHRAIMVQEWRKPAEGEEPPWPVLYGELEGRCPFTRFEYDGDVRRRMKPNRHETLRRTVSLSHLKRRASPLPSGDSRGGGFGINRGASPYPLASGNSMSVTSNIASTTSNVNMSGMQSGLGIYSPHGAIGRKMVLQGNALGLGRPSSIPSHTRSSHSSHLPPGAAPNGGSLVRRMLGMAEQQHHQSPARRSISTPLAGQVIRREKKPGYCENCRLKYEDFDDHIVSRKHRKFAEDDGHFADIDTMLARVCRPIAPWALDLSSSPSDLNHEENDVSSTSSLLAAGGSLLEAEGARSYDSDYVKKGLTSPRQFRHAMEEWQQKIHQEAPTFCHSPRLPRSPLHRNVSLPPLDNEINDGDSTGSSRFDHSMNATADMTATTVTTTGPRTEGEEEDEGMAIISPHTSPNIHHHHHQQYAPLHHNNQEKVTYIQQSPRHNFV